MDLRRLALLFLAGVAATACGGNLGDLARVTPIRQPLQPPPAVTGAGIIAMCAADGEVRIDYLLPGSGFEAALFVSQDPADVYQTTPVATGLTGSSIILSSTTNPGLIVNGTLIYAGFAIRRTTTTNWSPIGTVVRSRPSTHNIYVDPNGPVDGNGQTPATAFRLLDNALLVGAVFASAFGEVNVLVMEGTYTTRAFDPASQEGGAFTIGPNVHVYGGFKAGFLLADREMRFANADGLAVGSILRGGPTTRIADAISGGAMHIFDNFTLDGNDTTTEGIDVTESDCELRHVRATRCVDNGVRVRQLLDFTNRRTVSLTACDISGNGSDGLGVAGVFRIEFDRSTFDANGGSGVDMNDLLALEGGTSSVTAFGCRFFGNSLHGMKMDLNTIATANPTPGGVYEIRLLNCDFQRNGVAGLRIDEDHDFFPAWHNSVRVRECTSRGNFSDGIQIDADDQGDYVFDRVRSVGNAGNGLLITSEPDDTTTTDDDQAPGHLAVTNSYFGGNQGAGIRTAQGEKVALASHCAFAGNQQGAMVAELSFLGVTNTRRIGTAVSCVCWRQPTPFTNVVQEACWIENQSRPFNVSPEAFTFATALSNGQLTLTSNGGITAGQTAVLADDGIARAVTGISGITATISSPPATFLPPTSVFGYPDTLILDDLRLLSASAAVGTGLVPAGAAAVDPGPHGSIGGGEPGVFDEATPATLVLMTTNPPPATGVTPTTPVVLTFDRDLDPASVTPDRVVVVGAPGAQVTVSNKQLTVSPPPAGWSGATVLELHIGIAALDGTPFGTPLLLPIIVR